MGKDADIQLLESLTLAHGAPGSEHAVRRIVIDSLGGTFTADRVGSIMTERAGTAADPRVMVTAHMDEVGFAVQQITGDGYLRLMTIGGWWGHTLLAQRVRIKTRAGHEVLGVITSTPPHFLKEEQRKQVLNPEDMYVDIGASSDREVREDFGIGLGDPMVPDSSFTRLHRPNLLMCKAFDNRVGVGAMIEVTRNLAGGGHPNTLVALGTAQEEVGIRGAVTGAEIARPDVALVLEGAPADDAPGSKRADCQGALGAGAQVRLLDPTAIMNRELAEFILEVARSEGIPHQVAVRKTGGTDAKAFHLHRQGVPTVVIGTPARYIHTHNSIIDITDFRAVVALVTAVVTRLDSATVANFTRYI